MCLARLQCGDCSCSCNCQTPDCNEINCCCCQITTPNHPPPPPGGIYPPYQPPGSEYFGASGGYLNPGYPVVGTVYRDATMNPNYPIRTLAATAQPGIPGGVSGRPSVDPSLYSRPWTTGGSAAVHQPRPATTTTMRRPTITASSTAPGNQQPQWRWRGQWWCFIYSTHLWVLNRACTTTLYLTRGVCDDA